jgi:hypothetical protein
VAYRVSLLTVSVATSMSCSREAGAPLKQNPAGSDVHFLHQAVEIRPAGRPADCGQISMQLGVAGEHPLASVVLDSDVVRPPFLIARSDSGLSHTSSPWLSPIVGPCWRKRFEQGPAKISPGLYHRDRFQPRSTPAASLGGSGTA